MYKRVLIFAIVIGLATISASAQEGDSRNQIHIGAKLGFNVSNIYQSTSTDFETHSLIGLATGVFVQVPIWKHFGVQPELLFSQRGYNATNNNPNKYYNIDRRLTYLDLPLMASFSPTESVTFVAGPQVSILINQNDKYVNNSLNTTPDEFINGNQRGNLSFLTGIDFNFSQYVVSGRVGWDISSSDYNNNYNSPQYKNLWVQATFGIRI